MTRAGFGLALALFGVSAVIGVFLIAPRPDELGLTPTGTCAEWFAAPEEGYFELTDCEVDLRDPSSVGSYRRPQTRVAVGLPGDAARGTQRETSLTWRSRDPEIIALAERIARDPRGTDARRRAVERYAEELVVRRAVRGRITLDEDGVFSLEASDRSAAMTAIAVVLLLFGLFGLAVLIPTQRRWTRRERELGAGGTAPLRF